MYLILVLELAAEVLVVVEAVLLFWAAMPVMEIREHTLG